MNVFAKFDEIPSIILQDIIETKRYGRTVGRSGVQTDNLKTVSLPQTQLAGGGGGIKKGADQAALLQRRCPIYAAS